MDGHCCEPGATSARCGEAAAEVGMNVGKIISLSSLLLLLLPLLWACGEIRNSDAVATWQVDTVAVFQVGHREGEPAYQLYQVVGIAELPDGAVAIANRGSSEIRLYDASGRFVRALGRDGAGPGEFSGLLNLVARGDTLYAYDMMFGRLTRFLSSGAYLDDSVLRPEGTWIAPRFLGLVRDGAVAAWTIHNLPSGDGFQRYSAVLLRIDQDRTADTLGLFPGDEMIFQRRRLGGGTSTMTSWSWSFYRRFLAVAGGDRIFAAPNDSAVVYVWDGSGVPLDTLRWDDLPQPLDDALATALFERATAKLEPAEREKEREVFREAARPETAPVFSWLVLGPDGELWVRRFDQPGAEMSEWLVFRQDGSLQARARIPMTRVIRAVSRERIYTVELDEYDVEYVRGYRRLR
jgi:hypothetical protein